jgi:hypothetical protein
MGSGGASVTSSAGGAPSSVTGSGGGGAGGVSEGGTAAGGGHEARDASAGGNSGDASDAHGSGGACGAFPPVTDLTMNGPFGSVSSVEGPNCSFYHPTTLGDGGVKHPVILWANGTAGPTFVYGAAFEYWTSHGFIVAAGNSSNGQGSGAEILGCLDYLLQENARDGSAYQGKVCPRVGASGHSQGGGGALMAGQDMRVTATAPLMPYIQQGFGGFDQACIPKQGGPMLLLSGTADTIAPPAANQQPVFDGTNVPVFWANLMGGDHVAVSLNGLATYREVMLAWYRLHLMGDESFRTEFYGPQCGLCVDSSWQVQRKGI